MIFIAIINTIYAVIYALTSPLRLLPDVVLPQNYLDAVATAGGYLSPIDMVLPLNVIADIISLFVYIELAYLSFKAIMWVIKRFPTQS
jgi:hypothetical protein